MFCHPERGTRYSEKLFAEQFRAALLKAEITDYVRPFHDLRHTALTNEAASGSSPIALMAKAGHSDMKTTRIYLHLAGTVFRDEAEALSGGSSVRQDEGLGSEQSLAIGGDGCGARRARRRRLRDERLVGDDGRPDGRFHSRPQDLRGRSLRCLPHTSRRRRAGHLGDELRRQATEPRARTRPDRKRPQCNACLRDRLSRQQIRDVAAYVVSASG